MLGKRESLDAIERTPRGNDAGSREEGYPRNIRGDIVPRRSVTMLERDDLIPYVGSRRYIMKRHKMRRHGVSIRTALDNPP